MRVAAVESFSQQEPAGSEAYSDVAVERALKNFAATVGGDDSLFTEENSLVYSGMASGQRTCTGKILLRFRDQRLMRNRGAHFSAIEKLSELLKQAGSADSLSAMIALSPSDDGGYAVQLRLEATGSSAEQAGLRWGLGLAHIQQAVLFTSRLLRQQLAQAGD